MPRPVREPFQILVNSMEDVLNTVSNSYQVVTRLLDKGCMGMEIH